MKGWHGKRLTEDEEWTQNLFKSWEKNRGKNIKVISSISSKETQVHDRMGRTQPGLFSDLTEEKAGVPERQPRCNCD